MVKKIVFWIILLSLTFGSFPKLTFAANACTANGITFSPANFPAGQKQYDMKFTFTDAAFSNVKNKFVKLLVDRGILSLGGTPTASLQLTTIELPFTLTGNSATENYHSGILQVSDTSDGTFTDTCTFTYQIGVGKCTIAKDSIPSLIPPPPNNQLQVAFIGKAGSDYSLIVMSPTLYDTITSPLLNYINAVPGVNFQSELVQLIGATILKYKPPLTTTKTKSDGQGIFPAVSIPGQPGDTDRLIIVGDSNNLLCYQDTVIRLDAPKPSPPSGVPVAPGPASLEEVCPKPGEVFDPVKHAKCASSGGQQPGCVDARGPAIRTAIGCIHTNPPAFVEDLLTFMVAIGGGLAFLMMLLGAFQMLTSAGNPETLNAGRERLTSAVIGLLFVIFAVLLLQIIGVDILFRDLPGFKR